MKTSSLYCSFFLPLGYKLNDKLKQANVVTGCLRKRPNLFILYLVQALPAAWEGGRVVEMESNKQFSKNGSGLAQEEVDLATMGPGQR